MEIAVRLVPGLVAPVKILLFVILVSMRHMPSPVVVAHSVEILSTIARPARMIIPV